MVGNPQTPFGVEREKVGTTPPPTELFQLLCYKYDSRQLDWTLTAGQPEAMNANSGRKKIFMSGDGTDHCYEERTREWMKD